MRARFVEERDTIELRPVQELSATSSMVVNIGSFQMNEFRIPAATSTGQDETARIKSVHKVLSTGGTEAANALVDCMSWRDTPCGDKYWTNVYELLCRRELLPLDAAMYLRLLLDALKKRSENL